MDGLVSYLKNKTKLRSELCHIMTPICTCCPVCTSLKLPVSGKSLIPPSAVQRLNLTFQESSVNYPSSLTVFSLLALPSIWTCSHPGNSALPAPHGSVSATLTLFFLSHERISIEGFIPSVISSTISLHSSTSIIRCCGFIQTPSGNYKYSSLLLNVLLF